MCMKKIPAKKRRRESTKLKKLKDDQSVDEDGDPWDAKKKRNPNLKRTPPSRIERLCLLVDSTHVGFERAKYLNKDNKDDFTVDESEIDVSRDSDESADNEANQESMHKLMLKRGFRPYPNEKQFDRAIVYAVHKRAKDPQETKPAISRTSSRNSDGDDAPEKDESAISKSEMSRSEMSISKSKKSKSKKGKKGGKKSANNSSRASTGRPPKTKGSKRRRGSSRKAQLLERYRYCDIIVHEYRYRRRFHDVAAEIVVICPLIGEEDRVEIVSTPAKFYMKASPLSLKDESDVYVVKPPEKFANKNVELDIVVESLNAQVTSKEVPFKDVNDIITKAFKKLVKKAGEEAAKEDKAEKKEEKKDEDKSGKKPEGKSDDKSGDKSGGKTEEKSANKTDEKNSKDEGKKPQKKNKEDEDEKDEKDEEKEEDDQDQDQDQDKDKDQDKDEEEDQDQNEDDDENEEENQVNDELDEYYSQEKEGKKVVKSKNS